MEFSPPAPPILNLRGQLRPILHRPGLAAAACWLFAAHHLLRLAVLALDFVQAIEPQWWLLAWTPQLLCLFLGAVLLDIANVGGPEAPTWLRGGITISALTYGVLTVARFILQTADIWGIDSPMIDMLNRYPYLPAIRIAEAALVATYVLGLICALRLARRFGNRPLEIASSILLPAATLIPTGWIAYDLIASARPGLFGFRHLASVVYYYVIYYGNASVWTCLLAYFVVLAIHLGGAARRQATIA